MPDVLAVEAVSIAEMADRAVDIGLRILLFIVILVVGWIISRLLFRLIDRLLDRIGFNRMARHSGLRKWTGNYEASTLFAKIIYYALLLFTLQWAFRAFGPNPVSDAIARVIAWLPKLLVALVIVIVAAAIANAVADVIRNALGALSYGQLLARIAQIAIVVLGLIAALNQVGVATTVTLPVLITALATLGGIAVVGIGGGLVKPMTERWERILNRAEREGAQAAAHLRERASQRGAAFGQPAYRGQAGATAMQDVQRAAYKAGQEARQQANQPGQPEQSSERARREE